MGKTVPITALWSLWDSIVAAFAVAEGVPPQSSDIRNAYFQALPIGRIVIMRQPSGGLPGVDPEAYLLIRVPVYGLCDSGGGFWKKVNNDALDVGLKASRIFPAFYYHESNGRVDLVLTTHVDDFLWACTDSGQVVMDKLLKRFGVGKREIGRLRFCGKQFSLEGKDVLIDVCHRQHDEDHLHRHLQESKTGGSRDHR